MSYSQHLLHRRSVLTRCDDSTSYWAISPDISTVSHNWAVPCSADHLRSLYSLERRVVQLELVAPGSGGPHPLVAPERTESVGHEGKQLLVVPQTLAAGQDGTSVHLNATTALLEQDALHHFY